MAWTSIFASANRASSSSELPPSIGSVVLTSPCSASAFSVPSGMVLIVNGAAKVLTYNIRSLRILGPGAGPQQALRTRASIVGAHPSRRTQQSEISLVGSFGDGDAEPIVERLRHLAGHRDVPGADEDRCHRWDVGLQSRLDAPFDAAHECVGGREVLVLGEQQRDVDRHPCKDRFFDGRQAFGVAWNLDEDIGT